MIKVLSLFGGMECGRIAFDKLGTEVEYYSAEFDPYPIKLSSSNYPDIIHLGSVTEVDGMKFDNLDWLIGWPPCQDLSIAGKRAGLRGARSGLFYEYVRILNEAKPKFFLVENVASMPKEAMEEMTKELFGITPVKINSALVSAQNRKRLYWIGKRNEDGTYSKVEIPQPEDRGLVIRDILEEIPFDAVDGKGKDVWKPVPEKYLAVIQERIEKFSTGRKAFAVTATYANACIQDHLRSDRTVLVWQWRRTDLRVHADQEKTPTPTANMGTWGNNVPVVISEPYCLNPQQRMDGRRNLPYHPNR